MSNNFYIRFNYKNIIPFNLKKKKLRVHANIIGSKPTNLYGFFIDGEVKFWYYYFGINGLKRDNVFLVKKFLNKKLGVFFISNFNMIEGKWSFPKIYEQYYKNYLFLKKKKINLFRYNLILNHNIYYLNNIFYIKDFYFLNWIHLLKIDEIYDNNVTKINFIINNLNFLYKFKKTMTLPLLFRNNNNNNYKIDLYENKNYFHNNLKKFFWTWNFFLKSKVYKKPPKKSLNFQTFKDFNYKRRNIFLKKVKKPWFQDAMDLFFKKKRILYKNKNDLNNFYIKKNIINVIQFIKLNKFISKLNKKNMLFLFYTFYLHFNFVKLHKNLTKKNKNKNLIFLHKNKKILDANISNLKKIYNKIIYIKLKKKSSNWVKYIFYRNLNRINNNNNFINLFFKLKKKLTKLYKYKIIKKNYILNNKDYNNNILLNNNYLMYYQLSKIWFKYNKIKKKKKINRLYFLRNIFYKKYIRKYKQKKLYLLWLPYIRKKI